MVLPLLDQINEKETIKAVERHLVSFSIISKMVAVTDLISIPGGLTVGEPVRSSAKGDKVLAKMNTAQNLNQSTDEYISWICEKINLLDSISRRVILYKYYYKMDLEEMEEYFGLSRTALFRILKDSKIELAFLLNTAIFKGNISK